jgi:hypothetical protein
MGQSIEHQRGSLAAKLFFLFQSGPSTMSHARSFRFVSNSVNRRQLSRSRNDAANVRFVGDVIQLKNADGVFKLRYTELLLL